MFGDLSDLVITILRLEILFCGELNLGAKHYVPVTYIAMLYKSQGIMLIYQSSGD